MGMSTESLVRIENAQLRERITELEKINSNLCRDLVEERDENQRLRDELWKEEKFCRASGDTDRADELAALLEDE